MHKQFEPLGKEAFCGFQHPLHCCYSHQFITHLREITNMTSGFHENLFMLIGFDESQYTCMPDPDSHLHTVRASPLHVLT